MILAAGSFNASASSFSAMPQEEVSALLLTRPVAAAAAGVSSAKDDTHVIRTFSEVRNPFIVNADDLVSKVYGMVNTESSRSECINRVSTSCALTPYEEGERVWLDSADGYRLDYYGMEPEVTAMARFDSDDRLAEYCYFFIFRGPAETKESINGEQAKFTGSLLQEMYDNGMVLGVNVESDDLMEVVGSAGENLVDIRLMEDTAHPGFNCYILMLIVEPHAFTAADDMAAL